MMETNFLINVILELDEFQQEKGKSHHTVEDFRIWLNEKAYKKTSPRFISDKEKQEVFDLENEIAKQVILLGRFSKQMIRRGLQDFPELANEEFTYLYRLMDEPNLTKMQLVEKNAHEKQTGIEIIRRLLKNKLIEETQDPNDKRTKRLNITKHGKEVFQNSVSSVSTISKVLSAKISTAEKTKLLETLKKLNEFHFTVYHSQKDADINAISDLI